MIDCDPFEPCPEACLNLTCKIAGRGAKVRQLRRVPWRDDEAKVMAVANAAFDKGALVCWPAVGVGHDGAFAIFRDAARGGGKRDQP